MSAQAIRELFNRHLPAASALSALGALLDERVSGQPLDPVLAKTTRDVLAAVGAPADLLADVSADEALPILAMMRVLLGTQHQLFYAHRRATGWNYLDPDVLQAGGDISIMHAGGLTRGVVPALAGLAERFAAPGARFLDIGVGAAGLSIALARMWPELRFVGIDVWQPSLAIARKNVVDAGLADRIELREQGAESLTDEAAFDFVWMPLPFMPARIVPGAIAASQRALRPGGWLYAVITNPGGDPAVAAVNRMQTAMWGGGPYTPADVEQLLRDAGLVDVCTLPSPPGAPACGIAGRKA